MLSVAHSFGTGMPASTAARITDVPRVHRDRLAVDLQRHERCGNPLRSAVINFLY